jgi:hypothetical protein
MESNCQAYTFLSAQPAHGDPVPPRNNTTLNSLFGIEFPIASGTRVH